MFFLFVPTQAYAQQVAPISGQLFQSIVSNHPTSGGAVTTITTTTVINHTTTPITSTGTAATSAAPFYRQYIWTNTLLIFFGGIVLGWGPICFAIALGGFVMLLQRSLRGGDITARFMLFTSVVALGSYFVVSFIFAPDPYYFSFQNYSTVIRFSDTALPGYFIAAPFFLSIVSRNRKRIFALLSVVVIFLLIAVPVYQTYAASNVNYTGSQNPFGAGYRTDAALMRDYFASAGGI